MRTAALLGEDGQPAPESSPVLDVSLRKYTSEWQCLGLICMVTQATYSWADVSFWSCSR